MRIPGVLAINLLAMAGCLSGDLLPASEGDLSDQSEASGDSALSVPSEVDCFYNARTLGNCPPPVITAAYLGQRCSNTTGVFVVGHYLQSGNRFDTNNGFAEHGPVPLSTRLTTDTWNELTPMHGCKTTSADPITWSGFTLAVRNPDGQTSNTVTVQNLLTATPPVPSSASNDPFDPDICQESEMTFFEALGHFAPGDDTAVLGDVPVRSRTRQCNSVTGCAAWGANTAADTPEVALTTFSPDQFHVAVNGRDCGRLGATGSGNLNVCNPTFDPLHPPYLVHIAARCTRVYRTERSTVAANGNYTQTDYSGLIRY